MISFGVRGAAEWSSQLNNQGEVAVINPEPNRCEEGVLGPENVKLETHFGCTEWYRSSFEAHCFYRESKEKTPTPSILQCVRTDLGHSPSSCSAKMCLLLEGR